MSYLGKTEVGTRGDIELIGGAVKSVIQSLPQKQPVLLTITDRHIMVYNKSTSEVKEKYSYILMLLLSDDTLFSSATE